MSDIEAGEKFVCLNEIEEARELECNVKAMTEGNLGQMMEIVL